MFKYGHRFMNSDSTNEWFQLLSRFRDSSVSAKDIETFHALIGGVLFPDEHHEASASESTVFRNLTCFANTIVTRDPNKNLKHSYLQARRLDKIEQYYQNTVKAASTTQNESTSLPLSFCKKHIVILCSERCQQMAYNDLAKQRHDVNNSPSSSTFISVAEDLCRYASSNKPVTTPIYFTKDEMQDLPPKELNLKVGMYVSIANNSVGHYWVKNMKVKK